MDVSGNIAVGYSVSSSTTYPSIRYAGRLVGDPLGTMLQDEAELIAGSYSQEGVFRWGDYSMLVLDPSDDCTFWYTNEYIAGPNSEEWGNWSTRIGSFKFPTCTSGPSGLLQGTITAAGSGSPISAARIDLGGGIVTFSDASGFYRLSTLPVGTYTLSLSAYGYQPRTITGVTITSGVTTERNSPLNPASPGVVRGEGDGFCSWLAALCTHRHFIPWAYRDCLYQPPGRQLYRQHLSGQLLYFPG